jgi:hypothetical protein
VVFERFWRAGDVSYGFDVNFDGGEIAKLAGVGSRLPAAKKRRMYGQRIYPLQSRPIIRMDRNVLSRPARKDQVIGFAFPFLAPVAQRSPAPSSLTEDHDRIASICDPDAPNTRHVTRSSQP